LAANFVHAECLGARKFSCQSLPQKQSEVGVCLLARFALAHVVEMSKQLVAYLSDCGPHKVHNVDNLLLRESMDVIGARSFPSP